VYSMYDLRSPIKLHDVLLAGNILAA
jgi:hypothetical protein